MPQDPLIVRAELPTPDLVVVRHGSGALTVFADTHLSPATIAELVDGFDPEEEPGHALG